MQPPNDGRPSDPGKEFEILANEVATAANQVYSSRPAEPTVTKLVGQIFSKVDLMIEKYQRFHEPLDCKKGCAWCCSDLVLATAPEILAVFAYIQSNFTDAEKEALSERVESYENTVCPQRKNALALIQEPCPLLVNNECSAYEARPLACRGRNSTNVEACRMWSESPGEGPPVPYYVAQRLIARAAEKGLEYGIGDRAKYELGQSLKLLIEDPKRADQLTAGTYKLLPTAMPAPPKRFPLDSKSLSPAGLQTPQDLEALKLIDEGQFAKGFAQLKSGSPVSILAKMRTPSMYASYEEILEVRDRMDKALDELEETKIDVVQALPALVEHVIPTIAYQGLSVKELLAKHGRVIYEKLIKPAYPGLCAPIEKPRKPGKLRVGYIGAISQNNGCKWALGWVHNHSPEIETYAFNLWAASVDHYYRLEGNLQRIAEFIREQDLDALIITELGFRRFEYIYYSFRLARIQCTTWGTPVTSGLPNMDYYLSSDLMEPDNAQEEYTEKLIRLPGSGLCYPRPKVQFFTSDVVERTPDFFPFMAQNIRKWTPQKDALLKRIADRYGKPLKMVSWFPDEITAIFTGRLAKKEIRVEMLPKADNYLYAKYLRSSDVSFDPPDWSGGNTTIEALSLGVPVVTLPGEFMRGRHSLAFLKQANLAGLIAKSEDDFVDLIFDQERQREVMKGMSLDGVYEDKSVVEALDEFLFGS
jgi:Fe-S-cluster containining protein